MIDLLEFNEHRLRVLTVVICLLSLNLISSRCLNDEGLALLKFRQRVVSDPFGALTNWNDDAGLINPCSWHGVECSEGNVVTLNLRNLCLRGTLVPELGNLFHIKAVILRNNSFSGIIPEVIGRLKELEVLDLGYNNFSGPLPAEIGNNFSSATILLDNNEIFARMSPEIDELEVSSGAAVQRSSCNDRLISWGISQEGHVTRRKLLVTAQWSPHFWQLLTIFHAPSPSPSMAPSPSPSMAPSPSPSLPPPLHSPHSSPSPSPLPSIFTGRGQTAPRPSASGSSPVHSDPSPSPSESPNNVYERSSEKHHEALIISAAIGGPVLLLILGIVTYYCRRNKVAVVRPWATGLSGQLQKAFVSGVPNLKRSELETACEDFSNVIGSSAIGTLYKGTLSSGVEIAVISLSVTSAKDWSKHLEVQFRKKIHMLSKVNHKNFVNLIGYCEEDEMFTRMLVFEYAPNGNLFEHLHIKESEHLDWAMRMRIVMGMAYCLEHMHQLAPPIIHKNLNSSAIFLTEDYASKISDFAFWDEAVTAEMESNPANNVYSFGVLLFEMITGRLPYSVNSGSLEDWASDYLRGEQPLQEMLDPTLKAFQDDQLGRIGEVIRSCVNPDPKQRPSMSQVAAKLREAISIGPDGAIPKLSPLWWAELEILSTEAC